MCRITRDDSVWWVVSSEDYGARCHDAAISQIDTFEDRGSGADPDVVANANGLTGKCPVTGARIFDDYAIERRLKSSYHCEHLSGPLRAFERVGVKVLDEHVPTRQESFSDRNRVPRRDADATHYSA